MRRIHSIILAFMLGCLLCSCNEQKEITDSHTTGSMTDYTDELASKNADISSSVSETLTETTTAQMNSEPTEVKKTCLYDKYLNNEVKSSIAPVMECNNYIDYKDWPKDGFTINELCRFLVDNSFKYGDYNEPLKVQYSLIDCAHDGEEELILKFESGLYDFQPLLVYKDVDGKLEMTELFYCYSRGWYTVNQYGYVVGFGASGAGTHHEYTGILDEKAKYQTISQSELSQTHYGDPGHWDDTGRFEKLYEYICDSGYEYSGYLFDAVVRTEFLETGEISYSFIMDRQIGEQEWELATDPDVYENSQFAKAFKKAGIELTSKLELDAKLNSFVKEDVRNGGEIQWEDLDINM